MRGVRKKRGAENQSVTDVARLSMGFSIEAETLARAATPKSDGASTQIRCR